MTQPSFIELYNDSIDILTTLVSELAKEPSLKAKYARNVSDYAEYVSDMLAYSDFILKDSVSSSKTFFTILSHIAINIIEDSNKSSQAINKIIQVASVPVSDPSSSLLRLDILINILNMIDVTKSPRLHARLFVAIVKYALQTDNYRRVVFPSGEVMNIIKAYSTYPLPKGEPGPVLSKEDTVSVLLAFSTIYEKLNRRSDQHHILQEYLNLSASADDENLGKVVANVVKSAVLSEIEALKGHRIIASHEKISKLLGAILTQNVSEYMNFYNENKDFVDGIKELSHEDILKTVRIFALAKLFSTPDKSIFSYDDILPVLGLGESAGNRDVEVWTIKGIEAKVFKAQLNPAKKLVSVSSVSFSKANDAIVKKLRTRLEKIGNHVSKSVEKLPTPEKPGLDWVNLFVENVQKSQESQRQ